MTKKNKALLGILASAAIVVNVFASTTSNQEPTSDSGSAVLPENAIVALDEPANKPEDTETSVDSVDTASPETAADESKTTTVETPEKEIPVDVPSSSASSRGYLSSPEQVISKPAAEEAAVETEEASDAEISSEDETASGSVNSDVAYQSGYNIGYADGAEMGIRDSLAGIHDPTSPYAEDEENAGYNAGYTAGYEACYTPAAEQEEN